MMHTGFSGYISYPDRFTNTCVCILDISYDNKILADRFAQLGCLTLMHMLRDHTKKQCDGILHFMYRYAEKIVILGMPGSEAYATSWAENEQDIDVLILFNSPVQSIFRSDMKIFVGIEQGSKQEKKDNISYLTYTPADYQQLLDPMCASIPDENELWQTLRKIMQFL